MRCVIWIILSGAFAAASGCASYQSLGEPIDDASRRTALLQACPRPDVSEAIFRTLIRWGGREISLTEVVKAVPDGGAAVAGITDIGSTLYAAQIGPDGRGHVISNSLPFSDQWLLDGLVAELLVPWYGPNEACQLYRQPGNAWALACREGRITRLFTFDETGNWRQFCRLSGSRLLSRISIEWDGRSIPGIMRVDNPGKHYRVVRERVSGQ
ncbi:MAG: hypothetical protein JW955_04215 [Sedimentisphaerales bacterium]|nr:hypothetical protein [Sedimentisphaerales bacterium]